MVIPLKVSLLLVETELNLKDKIPTILMLLEVFHPREMIPKTQMKDQFQETLVSLTLSSVRRNLLTTKKIIQIVLEFPQLIITTMTLMELDFHFAIMSPLLTVLHLILKIAQMILKEMALNHQDQAESQECFTREMRPTMVLIITPILTLPTAPMLQTEQTMVQSHKVEKAREAEN